jgi:hypothetical protein
MSSQARELLKRSQTHPPTRIAWQITLINGPNLAHFCVRAVLLRQSLYLLAVLNRPPQYITGMAQPFGHLLLVSLWMPQHFGRKEKALHIVK